MSQKTYSLVSGAIFLLIALGHVSRLLFKWSILIADWSVPYWVNVVAMVVAAYLALEGFRLSKSKPAA